MLLNRYSITVHVRIKGRWIEKGILLGFLCFLNYYDIYLSNTWQLKQKCVRKMSQQTCLISPQSLMEHIITVFQIALRQKDDIYISGFIFLTPQVAVISFWWLYAPVCVPVSVCVWKWQAEVLMVGAQWSFHTYETCQVTF